MAIRDVHWCMFLIRRSLGKIGCGVKHSRVMARATKLGLHPSKLLH